MLFSTLIGVVLAGAVNWPDFVRGGKCNLGGDSKMDCSLWSGLIRQVVSTFDVVVLSMFKNI